MKYDLLEIDHEPTFEKYKQQIKKESLKFNKLEGEDKFD